MADKTVPCYGCERRKPLCHSSCEDYKEYKRKLAKRAQAIRRQKVAEDIEFQLKKGYKK